MAAFLGAPVGQAELKGELPPRSSRYMLAARLLSMAVAALTIEPLGRSLEMGLSLRQGPLRRRTILA